MSVQWFCNVAGKVIGPFSPKQLKELADNGRLTPEHLVRRGEDGQWVEAHNVKGLFPEKGATPVATTPVAKPLPSAAAAPSPPGKGKTPAKKKPVARAKPVAAPAAPLPGASVGGVGIVTEDGGGQTRSGNFPLRRKSNPLPMVITLGSVLVVIIIVALVLLNSQGGDNPDQVAANGTNTTNSTTGDNTQTAGTGETTDPAVGTTATTAAADNEWADISKGVKIDDIQVAVRHVSIAPIPFQDEPRSFDKPNQPYLLVEVELSNLNDNALKTYKGWNNMRPALDIADEHNNRYRSVSTGPDLVVGRIRHATDIRADRQPVRDILIFNEPLPAAKAFYLNLPASAFGSSGEAKFKIARSDIKSKPTVKPTPTERPKEGDNRDRPTRPSGGSNSAIEESLDEINTGSPASSGNPLERLPDMPYPGDPSSNPGPPPSDEPNPFDPGGNGGAVDPDKPFVPVNPDEQPIKPSFHDDGSGVEGTIEELNQSLEGDGSVHAEPI